MSESHSHGSVLRAHVFLLVIVATAVVATVGLLLAVQGLIQWRYGTAAR